MSKPTLSIDWDGVIHSYSSGWKGATVIPDPPVPGAIDFIKRALEHFTVAIYSSRSGEPGGIEAMRFWLRDQFALASQGALTELDLIQLHRIKWPIMKPSAFVTLDDRALTFDGTWPSMESLLAFKPWNKRPETFTDRETLIIQLEAMAACARHWLEWTKQQRDRERLPTHRDSDISFPFKPSYGQIGNWVELMERVTVELKRRVEIDEQRERLRAILETDPVVTNEEALRHTDAAGLLTVTSVFRLGWSQAFAHVRRLILGEVKKP